jgi:GT2 family glycosyltransferase
VRASLIVHLQGGPEQALRCFHALALLEPQPEHEVIVVDDASVGLDALLGRLDGDVTVVRAERRSGLAGALALGAARASGDVLVALRGAPEVTPAWLAPLVAALDDPAVAAATSRTAGTGETHPVAAHAIAFRRADLAGLALPALIPDELVLGALAVELGRDGRRVTSVATSILSAPGARTGGARRTPGENAELTVVVPTLDATSDRVRRCLAAVQAHTDAPHEIVVVDNGAPPQGFTAPVNAGLRAARGRYAVVMNDDVEVLPGWWQPLRAMLDDGAPVAFPLTVEGGMRDDFAAWCFAISAGAIERFGHAPGEFFDPSLRVWYQDTDLLVRLRAAGCPPVLVEASRIRHGLSETVASEDPELRAWIAGQIALDREAFAAKHPGEAAAAPRAAA